MKKMYIVILLFLMHLTHADSSKYERCFNNAGDHYNIPPNLLKTIAIVESKMNPYAINIRNYNSTIDIGLMQINTSWLKRLKVIGVSQKDLLDGCININIGAWILAQNVKRYGLTAESIGRYNSANPYSKQLYIKKIMAAYNKNKEKTHYTKLATNI